MANRLGQAAAIALALMAAACTTPTNLAAAGDIHA